VRKRHTPRPGRGYCVNARRPRADDNTSVLPDTSTVWSPLKIDVYSDSNAIVAQAARVQARAGPTVRVCPDTETVPLHWLQSTRVATRPSANEMVYAAGDAWAG